VSGIDDEEIVVCPASSTSEVEVFQPHSRVGVPEVLDDVRRCVEARRVLAFLNAITK
jgi:hypothetical protein